MLDRHRKALGWRVYILAFCLSSAFLSAKQPKEPGWKFQVTSWNFNKAYPGLLYDYRLGVIGGKYPYRFTLVRGPKGFKLNRKTGAMKWRAPKQTSNNNIVEIKIKDANGKRLVHRYSIDVTKSGFYFVAPNGNDANDGSLKRPWKSLLHARRKSKKGDVLYFRKGVYMVSKPKIRITANEAHVWMSYPGETATIDGNILEASKAEIYMADVADTSMDGNFLYQNLEFINCGAKVFRAWAMKNAVFRQCHVHKMKSKGAHNPSFVMTLDAGNKRPSQGHHAHMNLVFQENHLHDFRCPGGGGIVLFNACYTLFEDNHIHDIDGTGVNDKDDGYYNTFRNNVIHDVAGYGMNMMNQYTQEGADIHHNLFYNLKDAAIVVGYQGGYIKDIYVHHNTVVNSFIYFRWVIAKEKSGGFHTYNNLVISKKLSPVVYETDNVLQTLTSPKASFDRNLYWSESRIAPAIASIRWWGMGKVKKQSFSEWKKRDHDRNSKYANPKLDDEHKLPVTSPYLGIYGRQIPNR